MRLEALILITAAAVEVSAKTFHMKYPGPLVHTRRKPRQTKAPEVSHLQLNRDAADNRDEWEEIIIELDKAVPTKAPSKLETRGDGGKLQGCHGKKCGNRFYRESQEEETTTTEHHEDEGFEEKYWVEHISSHKDDSHSHKSEVDHHGHYHRYNDTDDHYHHHHHPKSEDKKGKKGKKVKVEAREADLTDEMEATPVEAAAKPDATKRASGNLIKVDRKVKEEVLEKNQRYEAASSIRDLCTKHKQEKKQYKYNAPSKDVARSEKHLDEFCKAEFKHNKVSEEEIREAKMIRMCVNIQASNYIGTKEFRDAKAFEKHLYTWCAKEVVNIQKGEKKETKKHVEAREAEAEAGGDDYIKQRIYELKQKKTEEEKHTHKDDIEYYREEIHHDDEESHNAGHHHDSYHHYHHKPQHHHHHHPHEEKKKVEDPKKGKTEKKTKENKKAKVEARDAEDFHEGLTHEHVCTYFRGIAYRAHTLQRPVEQFQYENVPWLIHARGPWHHVLDGLRQIEWVLAKVARGLHETSGFTAREERELVGCYYAFAGINSPNGDNGQPFKKLLHLIADRSKMAKYEPYAQKRVHDVVRNLETAYLAANDQLYRVMREDKYKANILWDVKDKEGVRKYFAEVLRAYDVERYRV